MSIESMPCSRTISELEQALRIANNRAKAAEAQLLQVTNQLHSGVLLINSTGVISSVNKWYCDLVGVTKSAANWIGRPAQLLLERLLKLVEHPELYEVRLAQVRMFRQSVAGEVLRLRSGKTLMWDYTLVADTQNGNLAELMCYYEAPPDSQIETLCAIVRVAEHNPNPVVQLGTNAKFSYANPASCQLWKTLLKNEQRQSIQQLRLIANVASKRNDSVRCKIGIGTLRFTACIVPVAAERYVNIYLFDVSAQWERENQLREFQALIQDGFYITSRAVFLTEANGRFLFKNRAMQMLEREYQALTIAKTTTPEIIPESDTMALASGKETIEEISYTLPSGQVRWLQTVKRHLRRADGSVYVLGECTDITDITLTRQTLERSEKQYRDLIYYSPAIIVTHDLNGVILSCNPTMANLLQVSGVEVVGKDLREFMPAEYLPQVPAYLDQIAAKQEVTGIYTIETRERQVHHLLYQSYRVDEDGRLAYVIVYAQDVTQRLRTDRELKRAKEAAEAAVQARENFLANMSHEIRTPMNGVLGMARQLAKTQLDARQQEQLEIITSSGQHLLRILNDVLDMAKITSGKLELEQSVFNLCDSMKQAVEPLIIQAVEKGIAVRSTRLHESCAGPWVSGDAYRLNQVLINLVANAVKFTPSGGSIYIEGLLLRETNTHLTTEFSVSDTGIGIAADKLESIFEDFAQGSTDTTRQYGGTGLGLSICRALVAQLDGKLSVESELGRGSKFSFVVTLPRAEPVSKIPRRAAFDTGALRGRRILVTEDNKINRSILQLLLSEWGVDVDEAEDGAVAVALACQRSYDAILMDIQMPVLSGVEATWQIRKYSKARHAKVPILALTANAFRADCERYLAAGMEDCLTKPFEEAELYQKLVVLLENRTVLCYNLTGLYKMAQGNHIFVQSIIRSFLTNMPATVNELRQAAQTAQWPKVAKLIHHIKPNLEQLRITAIRPAVEMLMQPPNEALEADDNWVIAVAQVTRHLDQALLELASELM